MATVLVTPLGLSPGCSLSPSKEFPREGPGDHADDVFEGRGQSGRGWEDAWWAGPNDDGQKTGSERETQETGAKPGTLIGKSSEP